jgi:nitrogen fixation NifU-like protein
MGDLGELYQQLIVEHSRAPRNFRPVPDANRSAEGLNPLCGDEITLQLRLERDRIADIGFRGSGCAISKAAASLMTGAVAGKTTAEAADLFHRFHAMITSRPDSAPDTTGLGKLAALAGVRAFPARVKCASLAWHTLQAALEGRGMPVSTESPSE